MHVTQSLRARERSGQKSQLFTIYWNNFGFGIFEIQWNFEDQKQATNQAPLFEYPIPWIAYPWYPTPTPPPPPHMPYPLHIPFGYPTLWIPYPLDTLPSGYPTLWIPYSQKGHGTRNTAVKINFTQLRWRPVISGRKKTVTMIKRITTKTPIPLFSILSANKASVDVHFWIFTCTALNPDSIYLFIWQQNSPHSTWV